MTQRAQRTQCVHCTVPTDSGDICTFCRHYVPPTPGPGIPQRLDDAVRRIDALRRDLAGIIAALPGEVSMCLVLDLSAAGTRLRDAAALCDRAADQLETDAEAVR